MSNDPDVELVPEEQEPAEQSVHQAWFDAAPREPKTVPDQNAVKKP